MAKKKSVFKIVWDAGKLGLSRKRKKKSSRVRDYGGRKGLRKL